MGYYVTLADANFRIPETPEVLAALHAMQDRDDLKRGGSFVGGEQGYSRLWFSWMPEDLRTINSVDDFFRELGFGTAVRGDYVHLWSYESKIGQEEIFLAVVAPFVEEYSYLTWRGEDGALWQHEIRDGALYVSKGVVSFIEPKPVTSWTKFDSNADGVVAVEVPILP